MMPVMDGAFMLGAAAVIASLFTGAALLLRTWRETQTQAIKAVETKVASVEAKVVETLETAKLTEKNTNSAASKAEETRIALEKRNTDDRKAQEAEAKAMRLAHEAQIALLRETIGELKTIMHERAIATASTPPASVQNITVAPVPVSIVPAESPLPVAVVEPETDP